MSTTEFLLQVRVLERTIWRKTMQHDELESCLLPAAIRYDKDVVQTSPEDKLADIAAAVIELEKEIRILKQRKAKLAWEIGSAIEQLEDDREKTILMAYYVGRVPMHEIAERIGYSIQHTYRLRKAGTAHLNYENNENSNYVTM